MKRWPTAAVEPEKASENGIRAKTTPARCSPAAKDHHNHPGAAVLRIDSHTLPARYPRHHADHTCVDCSPPQPHPEEEEEERRLRRRRKKEETDPQRYNNNKAKMWGQSSRGFDRKNAYFRPIEDDDQMACSSSSPSAASSPVSFWSTTSTATSTKSASGVTEDDLLTSLHEEARKDRERMKLINELILSEREYVQDLEAINSVHSPSFPPPHRPLELPPRIQWLARQIVPSFDKLAMRAVGLIEFIWATKS